MAMLHAPASARPRRRRRGAVLLLVAGVALAGLNLRIAVTSTSPVLEEVTLAYGLSPAATGLLTSLPPLSFALFGALGALLARAVGEQRVLVAGLLAIAAGLAARPYVEDAWAFMLLSALALAGGAVGNVLLPGVIKRLFPERIGVMTTIYTTAMALGTAGAAAATVPAAERLGGDWRAVLAAYSVLGLAAAVPWLLVLRGGGRGDAAQAGPGARGVLRTALGVQSAVYFGSQSAIAYILFGWYSQLLRTSGMTPADAGLMLAYLSALSIPASLVMPLLAARVRDQRGIVVTCATGYVVGFSGLVLAPTAGVWLWTAMLGIGLATFPLALTLFGLRARTAEGTAALSATSQSLGYVIGGAGPLLFGMLYGLTGGWGAPLALALTAVALNTAAGLLLARPRYLEDRLAPR